MLKVSGEQVQRLQFNDVSFELPPGWQDKSVVTLAGRDSKRFAPNVVVTREAGVDKGLAEYAREQVPSIAKATKKHELLSERVETIAGQEGFVLEHRFITPERAKVRQLQYFVRSGGDVVVVSLTCAEQEVKGRANMLKRMAESLSIED